MNKPKNQNTLTLADADRKLACKFMDSCYDNSVAPPSRSEMLRLAELNLVTEVSEGSFAETPLMRQVDINPAGIMKETKNPPVVFVNIDGVLTSTRSYWANPRADIREVLDPIACKLLSRFCTAAGASLVLASQWSRIYSIEVLEARFKALGADFKIEGALGADRKFGEPRQSWEEQMHSYMTARPNTPYVLAIDLSDENRGSKHVTAVDVQIGLTLANLKDMAEKLEVNEILTESIERGLKCQN